MSTTMLNCHVVFDYLHLFFILFNFVEVNLIACQFTFCNRYFNLFIQLFYTANVY